MHQDRPAQPIESVILESGAGLRVSVLNLGATIQSIQIPMADGPVDAILGYAKLDDYWADPYYVGATVGRFANRIRDARFVLDERVYPLDVNEIPTGHCLHGGGCGFHMQFWDLQPGDDGASLACHYVSPHNECGFPGNLEVTVHYQVVNGYSLSVDFRAVSDEDTVVSLANHAYFNLDEVQQTVDSHHIKIDAEYFTPVDDTLIPTGELAPVDGSDFDLRNAVSLQELSSRNGNGGRFDHNFVLPDSGGTLRTVAELYSPASGLRLRLHTSQPGLQLYTGDHLGGAFRPRQGLCLEAQNFPDAPNQPAFPSALLAAGDEYRQRTVYEFLLESPYS